MGARTGIQGVRRRLQAIADRRRRRSAIGNPPGPMSAVPVNSVEQTIVLGGVLTVDLVCEGKQPGHMALHADPRRKTPSLHVCTGTDLGTRQDIKMSFEIVAERAREPWPLAIYQHTQHDLPRPGGARY